MAVYEYWYEQDLNDPVQVTYTKSLAFSTDNNSLQVGVIVMKNGLPAELSGTVVCHVIQSGDPAGGTQEFAGSRINNKVKAVLPAACFAYPGQIAVLLQLVDGTTKTTLCKVIYDVVPGATDTLIDPGNAVPNYDDLVAAIQVLEQATAAAQAIENSIGPLTGLHFEEKAVQNNLFDPHSFQNISSRRLNSSGGLISDGDNIANYGVSGYIPVVEGRAYFIRSGISNVTGRACLYDENLDFVAAIEYPATGAFVAPEGAAALRITYAVAQINNVRVEEWSATGDNLFNAYSDFNEDLVYLTYSSGVVTNRSDSWGVSHYIPVSASTAYVYVHDGTSSAPKVLAYDVNLTCLGALTVSTVSGTYFKTFTTTSATAFVRIPYVIRGRYGNEIMAAGSAAKTFAPYHGATEGQGEPYRAYMTDHIYCAVGTTIEVYTGQACLDPEWYTCRWICDVGYPLGRKFQVTGTAAAIGTYPLTFQVIDKAGRMLYNKTATLHIVSATISTAKKIMIIGDSLTRANKPVLAELVRLSGGKLVPVGTITESATDSDGVTRTLPCESRSGWSPLDYMINSSASNPFYSSGFSWSHYISDYPANDPDIVAVFLGTNGMSQGAAVQADRIKTIVQNIRTADNSLPIIVVNTLFKSDQDGIGRDSGSDGYTSGTIGPVKRFEDEKVLALAEALDAAVSGISGVTIVNAGLCVDSEYAFGAVEQPVDSRNRDYEEYVPTESIHPQASGYYQIADALFGAYCAIINA